MSATSSTMRPEAAPVSPLSRRGVAERRRRVHEQMTEARVAAGGRLPTPKAPRPAMRRAGLRAKRAAAIRPGRFWDRIDSPPPAGFLVIGVTVAIFVMLGLVMVLSASAGTALSKGTNPYEQFNKQLMWAAVGVVGLAVAMRMNIVWLRRFAIPLFVVTLAGMAAPFVGGIGDTVNEARAWIAIGPFGGQPSEFLKIGVVLFLSHLFASRFDERHDLGRVLLPSLVVAGLACGACLVQGDLGSAIVMFVIIAAIAFIVGVPMLPLAGLGVGGVLVALAFVYSSPRRFARFTAFLDVTGHRDHLSYQIYQGFLSIADGGLLGSGIGAGNGKLGYLPKAHNDFIFAVIADELGFVGAVAVIGGFMLLTWFGVQAALAAPDRFSMLVAGGVTAWLATQAVVNLGGVSGLMPVTGLTLPFFSAGGSSLFVSMTAAGLLLNVARRTP